MHFREKRKNQEANRLTWFTVGLFASLGLLVSAFSWTNYDRVHRNAYSSYEVELLRAEEIPVFIPKKEEVQKEIPKSKAIIDKFELVDETPENTEPEVVNKENYPDLGDEYVPIEPDEEEEVEEEEGVLRIVEIMPWYEDCFSVDREAQNVCSQNQMIRWVSKNIVYPRRAVEIGMQGIVYVYFEINTNGEVENVKVENPRYALLDNEAVRVVKKLPKINPGEQSGRKVRVAYTIPVRFSLN